MAKPLHRQPLTSLEIRLLELSSDGLSEREQAGELGLPIKGVRKAKSRIKGKLSAQHWITCVAIAMGFGFIQRTTATRYMVLLALKNRGSLTATDVEIYRLISLGNRRGQVATRTGLSVRQVDNRRRHVSGIMGSANDTAIVGALTWARILMPPVLSSVEFDDSDRWLLTQLVRERSSGQIADELEIDDNALRARVQAMVQRVGASSVTHAVAIAIRTGQFEPIVSARRIASARKTRLGQLESYVLQELAEGRTQSSVSDELTRGSTRLSYLLDPIYVTLGVHGQVAAMAFAMWSGLLDQAIAKPVPKTLLTARQQAILSGMADGLTYRQISEKLEIPQGTVNYSIPVILRKLGAKSRRQALRRARAQGLL